MQTYQTPVKTLYRRDGADTSHEAAHSLKLTELEQLVLDTIAEFGTQGCISDQVQDRLTNLAYSSVTARFKALEEKGLIEIIGKRPGKSGRSQRIMRTTENQCSFNF